MCLVGMPSGAQPMGIRVHSSGSLPIVLHLYLYKVLHMQPLVYLYPLMDQHGFHIGTVVQ